MLMTGREWGSQGLRTAALVLAVAWAPLPEAAFAQGAADNQKGVTVTVVKATKTCFTADRGGLRRFAADGGNHRHACARGFADIAGAGRSGHDGDVGSGPGSSCPTGRRRDHPCCAGCRHDQQCQRRGRKPRLGAGRSAVSHHRARRIRNDRRCARQGYAGAGSGTGCDHQGGRRSLGAGPGSQRLVDDRPDHAARPGPHSGDHAKGTTARQFFRQSHNQDRRKLQCRGAFDRHSLRQQRRSYPGRAAATGRDPAHRGRIDVWLARSRSRKD